jgi:alkanesulfonate monooxygenase SsuD/methylene tetrahydromethanopterin reductase-like flavin-dependent oxidoreductase (luciferase family)
MATTVDILSEGNLRLGLGAGWHDEEHHAYNFDYPDIEDRIEMLDESIHVLKTMFTDAEPTFHGEYYRVENAYNEPKPVQDPHPPIVVGGAGPKLLRVAARHADEWNVEISGRARGPPIGFKVEKFDEYLEEAGRDPEDVERSWLAHILVREDERELQRLCDEIFPLPWGEEGDIDEHLSNAQEAREKGDFLIGTPAEVIEQIEAIRELGFERLQLMFLDFPDTRGIELFGDEVRPALQ